MLKIDQLFLKFIVAFVAVLLLTILLAGVLLNHAKEFDLENITITNPAVKEMYPELYPDLEGVKSGGNWYYQYDDYVYKDDLPWQQCDGQFVSVLSLEDHVLLVCSLEVVLFDRYEQMLDRMDESYGLPIPIKEAGAVQKQLFVRSEENKIFNIDLSSMEVFEAFSDGQVKWQGLKVLPQEYKDTLYEEKGVNLKRLLREFFISLFSGFKGKVLIDFILLFGVFVLTNFTWANLTKRDIEVYEDD